MPALWERIQNLWRDDLFNPQQVQTEVGQLAYPGISGEELLHQSDRERPQVALQREAYSDYEEPEDQVLQAARQAARYELKAEMRRHYPDTVRLSEERDITHEVTKDFGRFRNEHRGMDAIELLTAYRVEGRTVEQLKETDEEILTHELYTRYAAAHPGEDAIQLLETYRQEQVEQLRQEAFNEEYEASNVVWSSEWTSDDSGLYETRQVVEQRTDGYHGILEVSQGGGEPNESWSGPFDSIEKATKAASDLDYEWRSSEDDDEGEDEGEWGGTEDGELEIPVKSAEGMHESARNDQAFEERLRGEDRSAEQYAVQRRDLNGTANVNEPPEKLNAGGVTEIESEAQTQAVSQLAKDGENAEKVNADVAMPAPEEHKAAATIPEQFLAWAQAQEVKMEDPLVRAETQIARNVAAQMKDGATHIDLSEHYATGDQATADARHQRALARMAPLLRQAERNGYEFEAGKAIAHDFRPKEVLAIRHGYGMSAPAVG
jgi:hypothetical protein